MRTYERGVEDETLSCGTGVTAAALCASLAFKLNSPIAVETRGGNLTVHFENNNYEFTQIKLEGPVEVIFSGQIEI
jgi:diaminopimelate epimerase